MKGLRFWISAVLALSAVVGFAAGQKDQGGASASDYSERLTIQIANPGVTEGYDYNNGDDYAKFWSQKFNINFEMVRLEYGTAWTEALRIWINSRDMPDVAIFNYTSNTHVDAASWVEQGLIRKLPGNWKTRWPNAAAVVAKTGLGPRMEQAFGGTYFLPRARFDVNMPSKIGDPLTNHMGGYLRRDWAEAVGFTTKDAHTTSELIDFGKKILARDPGKVGANLIAYSARPEYAVRTFVYANSTYWDTFYRDKDGKYKWGGASPDTLRGLKKMYEAYSSGVLYPEFYAYTGNDDFDKFRIAGTAASAYGGGVATGFQVDLVAYFEKSLGLDSTKAVNVFTVLGEDGHYHQQDLINYWGAMIFSPEMETKKFERFMDMVDFGTTEEGYRIEVAGFEGKDYAFQNGKMVSLLPEGQALEGSTGKYPSIGGYNLGNLKLWDDFSFDTPVVKEFYRQRSRDLYQNKIKMGTPETFPIADWNYYTYDSPTKRRVAINYVSEYSNLVINAKSLEGLEANWKTWIDSKMTLIQPLLDELNK